MGIDLLGKGLGKTVGWGVNGVDGRANAGDEEWGGCQPVGLEDMLGEGMPVYRACKRRLNH